jgi:hypothetical protein
MSSKRWLGCGLKLGGFAKAVLEHRDGAIHLLDLKTPGPPVKVVDRGTSTRWSACGRSLHFVAAGNGTSPLQR